WHGLQPTTRSPAFAALRAKRWRIFPGSHPSDADFGRNAAGTMIPISAFTCRRAADTSVAAEERLKLGEFITAGAIMPKVPVENSQPSRGGVYPHRLHPEEVRRGATGERRARYRGDEAHGTEPVGDQ